jgi:SagB-type dehydrogenase family enzyme
MSDDDSRVLFDLFWENSKLNPSVMGSFSRRIDQFAASGDGTRPIAYPGADHALPPPEDALSRLMRTRRSRRSFGSTPLSMDQLGSLFSAFGTSSHGTRLHASAGGLTSVDVFGLLFNVDGPLANRVVYYNADNHSLSVVPDAQPAGAAAKSIRQGDLDGEPAIFVVFALRDVSLLAKYGERGGRFALIEVGHAVQNLALRLAHDRLAGVELGGYDDDRLARALGLDPAQSRVALVVACGVPPEPLASGTGLVERTRAVLSRRVRRKDPKAST